MGCINSKSTEDKAKPKPSRPKKDSISQHEPTGNKKNNNNNNNNDAAASKSSPKANEAKANGTADATTTATGAAGPTDSQSNADQFVRTVLDGTELFFNSLPDSQAVKQVVALTFMNSCAEVVRTKFRLKFDVVVELLKSVTQKQKLGLLQGSLAYVEERSMDDGFFRILVAWYTNNPTFTKTISAEAAQAILDTLYIRYTTRKAISFEEILVFHFRWGSTNQAAMEVFNKFAEGKDSMTAEQVGKFLRETQRLEVTDRQLTEKYKYRFGGGIHRYNFATYSGSVLTNNAVDPARTSDVWQDMTQPFTHYLVQCVRIESEENLKRAMTDGSRALVLNVTKGSNGQLMSGSCPLQTVMDTVKKSAFTTDTYPLVLCLSPHSVMAMDVQDSVAAMINESLGPMLAKGLMFEGAVISDPKFSPGALRKKVLVMSHQSALKPFIGFMVADMNKEGLGVRVTDVVEGTPAAKSGVMKGDWLTHINGQPIHSKQLLRTELAQLKLGEEFTLKRENLDEIKVVVGGIVDPQDTTNSPALSGITFFKFSEGPNPKPWDTQRIDATQLPTLKGTRKELANHFAFVSTNTPSSAKSAIDELGIASDCGVQFIDVDNSEHSLAWTRGRFCDNGRCGYLLKNDIETEKISDLTINIIGGPRILGCPPLSSATATLHGSGTFRHSGSQFTFSGCDDDTVCVVTMMYEVEGAEHSYIASFNPTLIRAGYRALPSVPCGEEQAAKKSIGGIYIFAKRS